MDTPQKTIVITGATSGIGFAAAKILAGLGAFVIGVGRSSEKCAAAEIEIRRQHPKAKVAYLLTDLSSQRQVRELAKAIRAKSKGKIDVLVNNAGAVSNWYTATEDGYELQFAVNHLAPFLLTHELLPLLQASPTARVITVSSGSHRNTRIHWRDVMFRCGYNTLRVYKQSKVANVLFTAEFNRRFANGSHLRAYAVDPGLVNTEIGLKGTSGIVRWIWDKRRAGGVTPEEGAQTAVFLAVEPVIQSNEIYWKDCRPLAPSPYSLREDEAAKLWNLSERLCGIVD